MLIACCRSVSIFSLALICALPVVAHPGDILATLQSPTKSPRDLAFDGARLWLLDDEARVLYKLDPATGEVLATEAIASECPQGITWAQDRLWISDEAAGNLMRLSPDLRTTDAACTAPGIGPSTAPHRLGGLAFDGVLLWSGAIAGWSSRMNQVDPETGDVVRFHFTKGRPEGIEIAGRRLWSATDNSGHRLGSIYEYDAETGLYVTQFDTPGNYPAGIAFDGEALWCVDRESLTIHRLSLH